MIYGGHSMRFSTCQRKRERQEVFSVQPATPLFLDRFMAVPNYTYLKLKMSGPNGVITVGPSYEHAYECDVECVEHREAILESTTLAADLDGLANEIPNPKRHAGSFEPVKDVKLMPLDPTNPKGKVLSISATLDPK
jgi:hypothetical protein